jgi:hypothetical protein
MNRLPGQPPLPRAARWKLFSRALAGLGFALALMFAPVSRADEAAEQKVKAAFVPHLIGFVTFPADAFAAATDPIRVAVLGNFPLGNEMEKTLAAQAIQGRAVFIQHYTNAADTAGCHVLLVGKSEAAQFKRILAATAGKPVLTIGDAEGFAAAGGVINFLREDGKVRFEINPTVASAAHLKISSRLLQAAHVIQP